MTRYLRALRAASLLLLASLLAADDKARKEPPVALLSVPMGVPRGSTTRVAVRGLKLDTITSVALLNAPGGVTVKLVETGKIAVPNQVPVNRAGDSQALIEIQLQASASVRRIEVVFTSPDGDSPPRGVLVDSPDELTREKEPNGGFRDAQEISIHRPIEGSIGGGQDVDVFRFDGQRGQEVAFEVLAERQGSALDSILTLYDEGGHVIAVSDDSVDTRDSRLSLKLDRDGVYFLGLIDAHDTGGPSHAYRLFAYVERTEAF